MSGRYPEPPSMRWVIAAVIVTLVAVLVVFGVILSEGRPVGPAVAWTAAALVFALPYCLYRAWNELGQLHAAHWATMGWRRAGLLLLAATLEVAILHATLHLLENVLLKVKAEYVDRR